MKFSLEYLEAFTAAAETGSFSSAARKLGKAQSRISTAISNLEIDLGVQLFDRSAKFPVLTEEGKRLLKPTRDIINRCSGLSMQADLLSQGEIPKLKIVVDELIPHKLLAETLEKFGKNFPETDVEVFMGVMGDVGEMVKSGNAHVGIEIPVDIPTEGCNWRLLGHIDFVIVVAKSHPLAALESVTPEELAPFRQLVTISRGGDREAESYIFGDRCWMCESSQVTRELLLNGQGWGAIAHYQVAGDLAAGNLVRVPVTFGKKLLPANICLVWKKATPHLGVMEWLGDALEKAFARSSVK